MKKVARQFTVPYILLAIILFLAVLAYGYAVFQPEMTPQHKHLMIIDGVILVLMLLGIGLLTSILSRYRCSLKHLHDAETMISQLRESFNNGFVRYTPEGKIIEFNETYRQMVGYEEGELKGMFLQDLTSENSQSVECRIFENLTLTKGFSDIYEKQAIRKDAAFSQSKSARSSVVMSREIIKVSGPSSVISASAKSTKPSCVCSLQSLKALLKGSSLRISKGSLKR